MKNTRCLLVAIVLLAGFLTGCHKDEPETSFESINKWIYGEMDLWYFWTDHLPRNPSKNTDPETFYTGLLYSGDRFSFIYEDYEELLALLKGVSLESGFEFKLYREATGSRDLFMQISYIKKGSPADLLGLHRGDQITEINGTQLTEANYRQLLADMDMTYEAFYKRYDGETGEFKSQSAVVITPVTYAENPVFLDTIYEIEGRKIGYLIYNFFSPGPTSTSNDYDQNMDEAFGRFKSNGIEEMILDLRFNSGGSITSAQNLSALLVKNASAGDLMFKKQYNAQIEAEIKSEPDGGDYFLNIYFESKANNTGQIIQSNTVYVITSSRTASASEIVINALKPYMDVFIVGETTVGKDVGSVTLYDDDDPDNSWAIQPIVVKLINSKGEDYPEGFTPDVPLADNFTVLEPLGNVEEPLLNAALAAIGVQHSRLAGWSTEREPFFNSLDLKVRSNKVLLD